jgi:hypothetical protein
VALAVIPLSAGAEELSTVTPDPSTSKRTSRNESAAGSVQPQDTQYHRVEKGETLSEIAGLSRHFPRSIPRNPLPNPGLRWGSRI